MLNFTFIPTLKHSRLSDSNFPEHSCNHAIAVSERRIAAEAKLSPKKTDVSQEAVVIPTPQLQPVHSSHLISCSVNGSANFSPIVYGPQLSIDCAGGEPLHKEVSHYSRQEWTRVGSGTCGCRLCQMKRNSLQ